MRVLASFLLISSLASTAFAAPQGVICQPVKHCVNILKTHDADSFDYDVLRDEFMRHGGPGKQALIGMAMGSDDEQAERALSILSNNFALASIDVNALIPLWSKRDVAPLTKIFSRYPNARTRQMAIDTLGHPDPVIRAASRDIIAASLKVMNPLQSTDFAKLAQAIVTEPTPALLAMIGQFDPPKTTPLYVRSLGSSNPNIVLTAYEYLYAQDKALALNSLVQTLMRLKDDEVDSALAISQLLLTRNKTRPDGFYLNFANDIAKDMEMSTSGRAAGFDVVMRAQNLPNAPAIENTPVQHNNLKHLLGASKNIDRDYIIKLPKLAGDNPDTWLSIFWDRLKTGTSASKSDFIYQTGRFYTPLAKQIITEALADKNDWRVTAAAIQAAGAQRNTQALSGFADMASTHPISRVRASADLALSAVKSGKKDRNKLLVPINSAKRRGPVEQANRKTKYCRAPQTDLSKNARKLPYFDELAINPNLMTARYKLTTAEPTASGWFAGYDLGQTDGALVYFDNASGDGNVLLTAPVMAVVPVQRPPLGQTANRFWVITKRSVDMPDGGIIYRASRTANGSDVKVHATLPDIPDYISEDPSGNIFIAFKNSASTNPLHVNPPLLLSPNGAIARACERAPEKVSYQN